MNTWIISDTHFDHHKIIGYCDRPFKSAGHMNETMIQRWNDRVKPGDLIYHLGDFGLTKGDAPARILPRLNGKKILILGNHDKSAERMVEFGFDFACQSIVINHFNKVLVLNHKPLLTLPYIGPDKVPDYVLHGHIHNSLPEHRARHTAKGEIVDIPSFNINLSVEMINYEPVSLNSVIKKKIFEDKNNHERDYLQSGCK